MDFKFKTSKLYKYVREDNSLCYSIYSDYMKYPVFERLEKQRSINPANIRFFVNVAKLIIPAKIGVEQGLEAKANKTPIKKG